MLQKEYFRFLKSDTPPFRTSATWPGQWSRHPCKYRRLCLVHCTYHLLSGKVIGSRNTESWLLDRNLLPLPKFWFLKQLALSELQALLDISLLSANKNTHWYITWMFKNKFDSDLMHVQGCNKSDLFLPVAYLSDWYIGVQITLDSASCTPWHCFDALLVGR